MSYLFQFLCFLTDDVDLFLIGMGMNHDTHTMLDEPKEDVGEKVFRAFDGFGRLLIKIVEQPRNQGRGFGRGINREGTG